MILFVERNLMDQKFIEGGMMSGGILLFAGVMLLPLGIGALASYPDKIWPLGLLLLASSGVLIYSGINSIRTSSKKLKKTDGQINDIVKQVNTGSLKNSIPVKSKAETSIDKLPNDTANVALACWNYSNDEWAKFYKWERKERKTNTLTESLIIVLFGTFFIYITRESDVFLSLAISLCVAITYGLIKYFLTMASLSNASKKQNQVIFTNSSVVINGKLNPFKDDNYWLGKIEILEEPEPKVMEITYHWSTRKGNSFDEIRVPIPKGKLGEAVQLVDKLKLG